MLPSFFPTARSPYKLFFFLLSFSHPQHPSSSTAESIFCCLVFAFLATLLSEFLFPTAIHSSWTGTDGMHGHHTPIGISEMTWTTPLHTTNHRRLAINLSNITDILNLTPKVTPPYTKLWSPNTSSMVSRQCKGAWGGKASYLTAVL